MTFQSEISQWNRKIKKQINEVLPTFVDHFSLDLIKETPVVSGRMRASWHISTSMMATYNTSRLDPMGYATWSRLRTEIKKIKPGDVFYIHNGAVSSLPDKGPIGVPYSSIVNNTPSIRYGKDLKAPKPSFMFFDRMVSNGMLTMHFENAARMVIK